MPVRLNGSSSGYTELSAPAAAGNNTLTLPTGNGTAGQVLQTNGSGTLSWANGSTVGPVFSVYANATQTVTSGVPTKVALNAKRFDTATAFDATTNYRFQPSIAGYYQINGVLRIACSVITVAYAEIWRNGSAYCRGPEINTTHSQTVVSDIVYLNGSSDYIEMYGLINATGTCQFQYFDTFFTSRLSGCFLRS